MDIFVIIGAALLIVVSALIVIFTMMQEDKSEGIGSAFGDLGAFDGQRGQSRDMILKKYTKILAIVFGVLILAITILTAFLV